WYRAYASADPHAARQPGLDARRGDRGRGARARPNRFAAGVMPQLLLIAATLLGLAMIPFGLPGTLVLFAAALCYHLLVPAAGIGLFTVIGVGALMILAEGLEWVLTGRFTTRYGGSRRAAWGAVIGGMIGAFVGVPVPIVGSIVGAFAGAFVGAFVAEW